MQVLPRLEVGIALAPETRAGHLTILHPTGPALESRRHLALWLLSETGFAIILRKIYGRNMKRRLLLYKLLVAAGTGYTNDNFMCLETAVPLFPTSTGNGKTI